MTPQHVIRIGTRGSPLALAQANEVRRRLVAAHKGLTEDTVELEIISTKGDRVLDRPLAELGGKGCSRKKLKRRSWKGGSTLRSTQ